MSRTRLFLAFVAAGVLLAPASALAQYHEHHHYHRRTPRRALPPPPQVQEQEQETVLPSEKDMFLLGLGVRGSGIALDGYKLRISDFENPVMGGVGIHFRSKFTRHWGLELSADYLRGTGDDFVQWSVPVTLSALVYFFPDSRINPYGLFGAGVHFTTMEYNGGDFSYDIIELAGHLGAGVQVRLFDSFAIHADLRLMGIYKNLGDQMSIREDCRGRCVDLANIDTDDRFNLGLQFQAGGTYFF